MANPPTEERISLKSAMELGCAKARRDQCFLRAQDGEAFCTWYPARRLCAYATAMLTCAAALGNEEAADMLKQAT